MARVTPNRPHLVCCPDEGWWEFDLPMSKPISMNDRDSRWVTASKVKEVVDSTILLARGARIRGKVKRISVLLTYIPRDNRRRDPLNLVATLKAVEDGIVRAGGIVPDDNPAYVTSIMPAIAPAEGGVGRLRVRVIRLE